MYVALVTDRDYKKRRFALDMASVLTCMLSGLLKKFNRLHGWNCKQLELTKQIVSFKEKGLLPSLIVRIRV